MGAPAEQLEGRQQEGKKKQNKQKTNKRNKNHPNKRTCLIQMEAAPVGRHYSEYHKTT
jgi:hypothetical protein